MQGLYCATHHDPARLKAHLGSVVERMQQMQEEMDAALSAITSCPGACAAGKVTVRLQDGKPRERDCPLASPECAYGKNISRELAGYLLGIMSMSGVPPRHLDNFAKRQDTFALRAARLWHYQGFLVLSGIPGVGKSFGAAWVIYRRLRESVENWLNKPTWGAASKVGSSILWATAKEISDDKAVAGKARSVALLALDDLGKEEDTKTGQAAVRDVISRRYDSKLPTIITTEMTIPDISNRYGRYIAERLAEDTIDGGRFEDCGTASMRLGEAS